MRRLILLVLLAASPVFAAAPKPVEVWTYHLSPPYMLEGRQGLSHDFVALLNQDSRNDERFRFELVELPRRRIDNRLARHRPGVLLWATPDFFTSAQTEHASWSAPLLIDQQDFVSLPDAPFDYRSPASLHGLRLGGVLGHRYQALENDIASRRIERQDVQFDQQNIEKLLTGRIDTLLIPRSTLLYYRKQHDVGELHVSDQPLYPFARHILITHSLDEAVTHFLNEVLETLPGDPEWQILLHRYGLMPMAPTQ